MRAAGICRWPALLDEAPPALMPYPLALSTALKVIICLTSFNFMPLLYRSFVSVFNDSVVGGFVIIFFVAAVNYGESGAFAFEPPLHVS